jgi:hypothetical protein
VFIVLYLYIDKGVEVLGHERSLYQAFDCCIILTVLNGIPKTSPCIINPMKSVAFHYRIISDSRKVDIMAHPKIGMGIGDGETRFEKVTSKILDKDFSITKVNELHADE